MLPAAPRAGFDIPLLRTMLWSTSTLSLGQGLQFSRFPLRIFYLMFQWLMVNRRAIAPLHSDLAAYRRNGSTVSRRHALQVLLDRPRPSALILSVFARRALAIPALTGTYCAVVVCRRAIPAVQ